MLEVHAVQLHNIVVLPVTLTRLIENCAFEISTVYMSGSEILFL